MHALILLLIPKLNYDSQFKIQWFQEEESAFSTSSGTIFLHTDYKGFADSILLNALLGSFFDTYKK